MKFISASTLLALPILAAATTTVTVTQGPTPTPISQSQCNTGPVQCCDSTSSALATPVTLLLGLLGLVIQGVNLPVGLTCSPILGTGNSCNAQPVCCQNNSFNGVIAIGCSPVNLNL